MHKNDVWKSFPTLFKAFEGSAEQENAKSDSQYRLNTITDKQGFFDLKDQWNQLVNSIEDSNPFMLWEWLYTWWDVYGDSGNKLHILTVYKANQLIAVAPFYVKKRFKLLKRLSLLGEGEHYLDEVVTHYPDIIVSNENRKELVLQIVEYLTNGANNKGLFHFASFSLLKNNAVIHDVSAGLSAHIETQKQQTGSQFKISLPTDAEEYIASLSKSVKKQFRMKTNRLTKLGELEITSEADNNEGLKIVEKLVRARWESKMPTNIFDSTLFQLFHHKLAQHFQGQDVMDIRTMRLDGVPIVSAYNFNYKKSSYAYLSGFKSENDSRLSPMFIFDLLELKTMINNGYQSYDLLVSESDISYKTKFGCDVLPCYSVVWFNNITIGFIYKGIGRVKPLLSKIYHAVKGS